VQEVRLELLRTLLRQFRINSFFLETMTPFIMLFATLQTVYLHEQLYFTLHER